jgi:hypothetical protein
LHAWQLASASNGLSSVPAASHAEQAQPQPAALVDLEALAGGDPRQRRQEALERIAQHWRGVEPLQWQQTPEDLIRADRER